MERSEIRGQLFPAAKALATAHSGRATARIVAKNTKQCG
jgi:hypothetical protein